MTPATDTYVLLRAFVDELARCGMRAACTSPGSRSTPIVLSLVREPRLRCFSHIDERAAGFFALGLTKASRLPVAVACTSGTAAAELLPAAIEAHEARVPLLLLTADRPPELREVGAGQAIDQLKLYGGAAKWFFEVGTHEATPARLRWMRTLACRAYWTALEGRPGAVHLNFPLREPLVADSPLPADESGRSDGRPFVTRAPVPALAHAELPPEVAGTSRTVVVAGRCERDTPLLEAAVGACAARGWPLLADPLSSWRRGAAAIAHYDALLREPSFVDAHRPELVIRAGDLPTSKPLRAWLESLSDVRQVALDPEGAWQDPAGVVEQSLALEPAAALASLTGVAAEPDWLGSWRAADERAAAVISAELSRAGLSEPAVAAELGRLLPARATLFVASSMPVRDIETFWPARDDPPRVLCNRGANGIDGTVSSAFGAAADEDAGPTVLLIGDVAFAHDLGGLLAARRLGLRLAIVLLHNDGGGLFDFLPVARAPIAREPDAYTEHVATPHGLDFAHAAELYGCRHERAADVPGLRAALERALGHAGTAIVEVRTDRLANLRLHRQLWDAVAGAVRDPR